MTYRTSYRAKIYRIIGLIIIKRGLCLLWLAGFAGLYGLALVFVVIALRRVFTHQPKPFEATIDSLTEDRACIRKRT